MSMTDSATGQAWLLPGGEGMYFAIAAGHCIEMVQEAECIAVPGTSRAVYGLLHWRQHYIPVLDVQWLWCYEKAASSTASLYDGPVQCLVLAWNDRQTQSVQYGALLLQDYPQILTISDAQAAPLPVQLKPWQKYFKAAFTFYAADIPIVSVPELFAQPVEY